MIVEIKGKYLDTEHLDCKFVQDSLFSEKTLFTIGEEFDTFKSPYEQPLGTIYKIKYDTYMMEITGIETARKIAVDYGKLDTLAIGKFTHYIYELKEIDKQIQPFINAARRLKSFELYNLFSKLRRDCNTVTRCLKINIESASRDINQSKNEQDNLIRLPDFPSFDTWLNDHDCRYLVSHGDYYIAISRTGWSQKEALFHFAVSTQPNPLNIHSSVIFDKVAHIDTTHDEDWFNEELEKWYDETISRFNKFWVDYIKRTYLNERSNNNVGDKNT